MTEKTTQRSLLSLLLVCCMLFLCNLGIVAQDTSYKGKVIDATTNEPLIGVSILEKGTSNGVITDIEGNFNIQTSPEAFSSSPTSVIPPLKKRHRNVTE